MPDEIVTTTETVAEQAKPAAEPEVKADEFDKDRAMATIEKLREFEKQAKAQAKKLAEYEDAERKRQDAELSETERLKKQLAEKDATLKTLLIDSWKREAAEKVGLPVALSKRLHGETPEELEADAKVLLETLPKANQPKLGATNPGGNATGSGETDEQRLARIQGKGVNVFDTVTNKNMGGGVAFTKNIDN